MVDVKEKRKLRSRNYFMEEGVKRENNSKAKQPEESEQHLKVSMCAKKQRTVGNRSVC